MGNVRHSGRLPTPLKDRAAPLPQGSPHAGRQTPAVLPHASSGWSAKKNRLWLLGLVVATFLVYQPVWHAGFIWDDDWHVTRPALQSWHGLQRIWTDVAATAQYYPLLHSVFWLEHAAWGNAEIGYHLANLALHACAAVLVLAVLRRLNVPGALLATAIFALHPVQVESVAWISEQKNTLSAVFYLASALCYLRFDRTRELAWYAGAAGLFVAALLTKTITGTLPGALLVVFWWQRGRLSWKKDVVPLVPWFLLGAGFGILTAWWELRINRCSGPEFDFTFVQRLLIAGRTAWFCFGKLIWPAQLTFIYPRWQIDVHMPWQYLYPLGAAALLTLAWAVRRRSRAPLAGLLYFGGTLFPVLGFLNLYTFRYSFVADHYQYLASLGLIVLVSSAAAVLVDRAAAWQAVQGTVPTFAGYPGYPLAGRGSAKMGPGTLWVPLPRWRRAAGYAANLAVLAVLAVLSWRQCSMYANSETLYRVTIQRNPDCLLAHYNLAKHMSATGKADEALEHYYEVLRLDPNYPDIHNDLANILAAKGQREAAIGHYKEALRLDPGYAAACVNLADMLASAGRTDEASEYYDRALQSGQECADFHNRYGNALAAAGKRQEAMKHFAEALRLDPDYALAHVNLANLLSAAGKSNEAVLHYERALALRPNSAETHNNLAVVLIRMNRVAEAIQHFNQALLLRPHYAMAEKNLALAVRRQSATNR